MASARWARQNGDRLGPYVIMAPLGAGGMGEVYRARDPRLERDVAIKILSSPVAPSLDRLERFEREARATGALSHPNVVTVFDVGSDAGVPYVVTELLEGQSLRDVLKARPLTPRKAADYGAQIARGLAAAHARGIVHRDVKPENLFLTNTGQLKLLDFGIAKLREAPEEAPVEPDALTKSDVRIGTAGYMSPEQALGEPVDERTDIFSLGAILYEMLTGRRAFDGPNAAARVAAVLNHEPPDLTSVPNLPPGLKHVIERCLEKRVSERFRSAHDVAYALEATSEGGGPRDVPRLRRRGPVLFYLSIAITLVLAVAVGIWSRASRSPVSAPRGGQVQILPLTALPGREIQAALSPDGEHVAFAWDGGQGSLDIYHMLVNSRGGPLRLTSEPAEDCCPAWSPDAREIAFIRLAPSGRGTVLIVPSLGGPSRVVTEIATWLGTSLSWSTDGKWLAVSDRLTPGGPFSVFLVDPRGSRQRLTRPDSGSFGDAFPRFSPDGAMLAFARFAIGDIESSGDLYTVPSSGGDASKITPDSVFIGGLDWMPDGRRLAFISGNPLEVWSVSAGGGTPKPLGLGPRAVLADWVGAAVSDVGGHLGVSVARGAPRMVFAHTNWNTDLWRISASDEERRPLVSSTMSDDSPQISPDGRLVAFGSNRSGHNEIWLANSDGSSAVPLTTLQTHSGTPRWSPDGRSIAFDSRPGGTSDVYVVDVQTAVVRRLTSHPAEDVVPSYSRDGQFLYFGSNRDGSWQVYRMPVAGGAAVRVTPNGGLAALESLDGSALYFSKMAQPGLWSMPHDGGSETRVAPLRCWGYWDVTQTGLVALSESDPPTLIDYPFGAESPRRLAQLVGAPNCSDWGLSVSRDGTWLVVMEAAIQSDLVLVDNLR